MRRGMSPSFIHNDEGKIIGVNLSSDFTAEHERGIKRLKEAFGIPLDGTTRKNFGIGGRAVTVFREAMLFLDKGKTHTCLLFNLYGRAKEIDWRNHPELCVGQGDIAAAWSDGDFGIITKNPYKILTELYEAFKRKDVCIMLGGGQFIENPGLLVVIASEIPKRIDEDLRRQDSSNFRLQEAVEKTNIRQILKEAGKKCLALEPKWKDKDEKEIQFWLNPYDQQNNNYGWFTLQDLLDWVQDKGRIPKKEKQLQTSR